MYYYLLKNKFDSIDEYAKKKCRELHPHELFLNGSGIKSTKLIIIFLAEKKKIIIFLECACRGILEHDDDLFVTKVN